MYVCFSFLLMLCVFCFWCVLFAFPPGVVCFFLRCPCFGFPRCCFVVVAVCVFLFCFLLLCRCNSVVVICRVMFVLDFCL